MSSGHYPCGAIQHCTEIIPVPQIGLTGRNAHPNRQAEFALRGNRGIDGRTRRLECRAYPVAGVFEQPTIMRRNGVAHDLVVCGQRSSHRLRVGLPPTGRTLYVGEQKGHHARGFAHHVAYRDTIRRLLIGFHPPICDQPACIMPSFLWTGVFSVYTCALGSAD